MKQFLSRRWFLLLLSMVMIVGLWWHDFLYPVANYVPLRYLVVALVLFLMALPLDARTMYRTLRRPLAPALGILMNSLALPALTWLLVAAVGWRWLGAELAPGLLVAAATPCTLASAAVWTRRAGGNDAASIMVTVLTNATCFLVTPFWLLQMTGQHAELDATDMIVKLALIVVLPMTLAQLLRLVWPVGEWATRRKISLGVIAQLGILTMILFGSVQMGHRFHADNRPVSLHQLAAVLVAVTVIHVVVLVAGMRIARWLQLDRADQIAVGFSGSQKTLMVGLQVSLDLGLNIIPMVAYHIVQLLIDTLVADRLRERDGTTG